ncbi:MAG TPA: hypothetical protein VGG45_14950 [Terracidiphilus sp.]|jgi:hypothetical protein
MGNPFGEGLELLHRLVGRVEKPSSIYAFSGTAILAAQKIPGQQEKHPAGDKAELNLLHLRHGSIRALSKQWPRESFPQPLKSCPFKEQIRKF